MQRPSVHGALDHIGTGSSFHDAPIVQDGEGPPLRKRAQPRLGGPKGPESAVTAAMRPLWHIIAITL
jgi:hypothetical protein